MSRYIDAQAKRTQDQELRCRERQELLIPVEISKIAVPADLSTLLGAKATIMVPLSYVKGSDGLRMKGVALEALLSDMKSTSSDRPMAYDV